MEIDQLLREIREEVVGLLFNRYVFRTHQEIVRRNQRLQGRPRSIFHEWAWAVYGPANSIGVRRLASATYEPQDVNLVRFLDVLIRERVNLWPSSERYYPGDAARARAEVLKKTGGLAPTWEISVCKRLYGEDRKELINAAEKANHFASKRVAHKAPQVSVDTKFSDLDEAIDTVRKITEKYTQLYCDERIRALEPLHRAGQPTAYLTLLQASKNVDLLAEARRRKLPDGWEAVFLEAWATPELISLDLGVMAPPKREPH